VDVRLTAEDGYQAERSYSIASAPEESRLSLTVEQLKDGEVSPYLSEELRSGDKLELRGPIGGYFVWDVSLGGPLFLVAGGSGIVPLMAMLRHRNAVVGAAEAERHRLPARLLYSSRGWDEVIYRDELAHLVETDNALEVRHTLTRAQPEGWSGFKRRIDRMMLEEVAWPPSEKPQIFVCGPTPLVESAAQALVELGHEPARIKTERFGPTGGSV
jgi:ferredoxin-NADP reductase